MAVSAARYTKVAVIIHWVMAAAILAMLAMGFLMTGDMLEMGLKFQMYQWHKSLGVILLWLIALRLVWRLTHKAPEMGATFPKWERIAASAGHIMLYLLMIALPISGWLMVSSSPLGLPTIVFGWFQWPHMPGVEVDEIANKMYKERHYLLAWMLIVMIAGHVGAVIKHWLIDKENILPRMWLPPRRKPEDTK